MALVAFVGFVYGFWWVCFKDTAYGAKARQNAEHEAASYVSRRYGPVTGAVCHHGGGAPWLECFVRLAESTLLPIIVYCDDDEPGSNDGCRGGGNQR